MNPCASSALRQCINYFSDAEVDPDADGLANLVVCWKPDGVIYDPADPKFLLQRMAAASKPSITGVSSEEEMDR